jgi:hypothetical protein
MAGRHEGVGAGVDDTGGGVSDRRDGDVELKSQVLRYSEAIHLVELGARAGLTGHLTGLNKALVHRLYRQIHGVPSPPGQNAYADTWYVARDQRMLHAAVVWRLYKQLAASGASPAQRLIDLVELYRSIVRKPLLDVFRVHFVPRLVHMQLWEERHCRDCGGGYVHPVVSSTRLCPGCRLYQRFRCRRCGAPFPAHGTGRYRQKCPECGARQRR